MARWPRIAVTTAAALVAACSPAGGEPDQADMLAAYQKSAGKAELRKIACEKAQGAPGYSCDFAAKSCSGPGGCGAEQLGSGRFVEGGDGWTMIGAAAAAASPATPPAAARQGEQAAPAAAEPAPSAEWLRGAWVAEGDRCAGDTGLIFSKGGGYASGLMTGSWSLAGDRLTIVYREEAMPGEEPGPTETAVVRIARRGADRMEMNGDPLRRCAAAGGAEPWFPGETFTTS